jgi:putative tryptophan/tyrosine transport system substrate-binding protein
MLSIVRLYMAPATGGLRIIAGLGSAAAWPVMARAQQPAMPVIGWLGGQSADDDYKNVTVPFLQGLKEAGYVEGQNVAIEYRYAENQMDRLTSLVADLVRRRVAVIVASGSLATVAAKAVTTIPIVFASGVDRVALVHRFQSSNHIRRLDRVCKTTCGRPGPD